MTTGRNAGVVTFFYSVLFILAAQTEQIAALVAIEDDISHDNRQR